MTGDRLPPGATAGALLLAAREALGLSIDAVAQQLKLAPRQVRALEDGDYTHLPGRTFIRGFMRSYAKLVRLDPELVLGALATGSAGDPLEAPALQQTATTMGELPTAEHSKGGWTRWAIPLTLAAVVAGGAIYEWLRPSDATHPATATAMAAAPVHAAEHATPAASGDPAVNPAVTSLPNPVDTSAPVVETQAQPAPASVAETAPAAAGEETLGIAFGDYSWTEIRDRNGRLILSGMNRGGTTQSVAGVPPLDLVIGNAVDVRLTFRGSPVDLVPYTRQNVARLQLQ